NDRYVPLALLKPDYRSARLPELGLPANSRFCFLDNGQASQRVPVSAGTPVVFAVEAGYLRDLTQASPLALKETVWLWRTEDPIKAEVHVTLRLFRSGPPRPL